MPKPAHNPAKPATSASPASAKRWYEIRAAGTDSAEVFIYGDIGDTWWSEESVIAKQFVQDLAAISAPRIVARINSYGGSVADGLAIHNALRRHPAAVETVIDGVAVSIASLIAMAGDTVSMHANGLYMMHAPSGGVWGTAADMRAMAQTLDTYAQAMAASYARKTGKDPAEMLALLTDGQDHWHTAAQALEAGFVDRIIDEPAPAQATAAFQAVMARYRIPAAIAAHFHLQEAAMPKDTTPAAQTTAATETQPAASHEAEAPNVVAIEEAAFARLAKRNTEIRAAFHPFLGHAGVRELQDTLIDDPKATVEQARGRLLAKLGEGAQPLAATVKPETRPAAEDPSKPLDERAKAAWDSNAAVRAEFGTFPTYLAFRKVEANKAAG